MLARAGNKEALQLADAFCREARERIEASFRALYGKHDEALYRLAQRVVAGEHAWVESGIVDGMGEARAATDATNASSAPTAAPTTAPWQPSERSDSSRSLEPQPR
jgi:hypothetical protein